MLVLDFPAVQHGARARVSPALSATNVAGAGCQTGSLATQRTSKAQGRGRLARYDVLTADANGQVESEPSLKCRKRSPRAACKCNDDAPKLKSWSRKPKSLISVSSGARTVRRSMPPSAFLQATLCISNKESAMAAQQQRSATPHTTPSNPSSPASPLQREGPSDGYGAL